MVSSTGFRVAIDVESSVSCCSPPAFDVYLVVFVELMYGE